MRGLNGQGLTGSSLVLVSAGTVVLVGTAVFAVGCATGGTGLRDGGPARTEAVSKAAPTGPSPTTPRRPPPPPPAGPSRRWTRSG
ncbi:hypothetical protein WKI68_20275 [Streptomyces sp. MS1.HAVA.3]|uniref:Lipoprotein n=1 Tax=Streptomyces caledonius TaxID=3134107 RepID=A0ABU8U709_9ACTN